MLTASMLTASMLTASMLTASILTARILTASDESGGARRRRRSRDFSIASFRDGGAHHPTENWEVLAVDLRALTLVLEVFVATADGQLERLVDGRHSLDSLVGG
jgi:hypothetical protein